MKTIYLPCRTTWPARSHRDSWPPAMGIALGFALTGVLFMIVFELQMAFTPHMVGGQPAAVDYIRTLFVMPVMAVVLGTAVATVPLQFVMSLERAMRVDLGMVAWILIGLIPTALIGSILAGTWTGGIAMASGGIAGMIAHALRRYCREDVQWRTLALVGIGLIGCMMALSSQMPMGMTD